MIVLFNLGIFLSRHIAQHPRVSIPTGAPNASPGRCSTNQELRETNELLRLKIAKLEQLLRLKDAKIERLSEAAELGGVLP